MVVDFYRLVLSTDTDSAALTLFWFLQLADLALFLGRKALSRELVSTPRVQIRHGQAGAERP